MCCVRLSGNEAELKEVKRNVHVRLTHMETNGLGGRGEEGQG